MKINGKFRVPLLLFVFYSLDMLLSYVLDPALGQYEMNPLARRFGWAYAAGTSAIFCLGLSYWWLWSHERLHCVGKMKKGWRRWFVSAFLGKGAGKRWLVAFGSMLPPASVAMKVVLVANNILFIAMMKIIGLTGMLSLKNSLGMANTPIYAFYITIFVSMMALMLIAGIVAASYSLAGLARGKPILDG